jgi:Oligonucleotide/oligosaccharide-binding (OB)-fold
MHLSILRSGPIVRILIPPFLLFFLLPSSQWILFQDFVLTSRNFVRSCTAIRLEWLLEFAPHYFDLETWPEGETKGELERGYRRLMQEMDHLQGRQSAQYTLPQLGQIG